MTTILTTGISFVLQDKTNFNKQSAVIPQKSKIGLVATVSPKNNENKAPLPPPPPPPPQKLSNPPEVIKAVYVTGYSAGVKSYLKYLTNLFKNTEVNAVVVDIKGSDGHVTYESGAEDVKKYNLTNYAIPDIDALVRFFHDQNIYVIGRIAVFEDPIYSKARPELAIYNKAKTTEASKPVLWEDNNKLSWLDPTSKDVWDYNVSLAKDALYNGFDEINFDYVRFPTDGNMANIGFPVYDATPVGGQGKIAKSEAIKNFFHYLRTSLPDDKISVDLFGLTTVNTDDMGIGQIIDNAFENFDYVSPMVYPSHYANGFIGFPNPAEHPYEVIKYSMDSALSKERTFDQQRKDLVARSGEAVGSPAAISQLFFPASVFIPLAKIRPWIQDFNMGAEYTADMVKKEINATKDSLGVNFNGFMVWNPSNIYTQGAVAKETVGQK
jgi:hypothetical protein